MPVYEYRCRSCRATRDEIQPMGSPPPEHCERCGGELRRVYGRVAVRFEGWGFGSTDKLVPRDRPRKDFRQLREKAEQLRED